MSSKSYKREMKLKVAKEAIRPENTHMEHHSRKIRDNAMDSNEVEKGIS